MRIEIHDTPNGACLKFIDGKRELSLAFKQQGKKPYDCHFGKAVECEDPKFSSEVNGQAVVYPDFKTAIEDFFTQS